MKTLKSFVCGDWHEARSGFVSLLDPSTEEEIARVSSAGIDFANAVAHARQQGGPALRRLGFGERGLLLKAMSKALREHRDELLDLSRQNAGTTAADGAFDIDGASGTLAYYAAIAKGLAETRVLTEGDGVQLARDVSFWGQQVLVPRTGVAVHLNAFNFPVWGFAEKAACALLAGMPVISKPATATAMVAERALEIVLTAGGLPAGALQWICGATGDLLDHLGPQDVVAFTGSAATAHKLRQRPGLVAANLRFNTEADSLNAAVLGPDISASSPTFELFVRDVVREICQKTGQKCTAVRRILVPASHLEATQEALAARLAEVKVGHPADSSVSMGPLASAQQLADTERGLAELHRDARSVFGTCGRIDGIGSPAGKGFFCGPNLFRTDKPRRATITHRREVFGPVATLMPYDGKTGDAAEILAIAGGMLVTSAYSDDEAWLADFFAVAGSLAGRLYIGSEGAARTAPGSGVALPQSLHGGPGRAGGGEELGGLQGIKLYQQRVGLQGSRDLVERLIGLSPSENE